MYARFELTKKTLVLCHDTIGPKVAGPGIRYVNVADQLKKVSDVTLAVYVDEDSAPLDKGLTGVPRTGQAYKKIFDAHDIIFVQWLSSEMLDYAKQNGKHVIIDLYAPVPIEFLASIEFANKVSAEQDLVFSGIIETYTNYLSQGDFFTCSNERQRDFWIGFATANNLIKPTNFTRQDLLKKFAIAPMGISQKPPKPTKLKLRSSLGLAKDDYVLLWSGGIWDWFDAQVVIRAVAKIKNPKVKLVFIGTKHPNASYTEEMSESLAARQLSEKLDLTDKRVFFLEGWVPYDERADYFMDADASIYADKQSLETRFSHRTRVLDHIWTELPTICSQGDYMAEIIEKNGFGLTVASRTDDDFSAAINKLSQDKKLVKQIKTNLKKAKPDFTWDQTLVPIVEYVKQAEPKTKQHTQTSEATVTSSPKLKMRSRVRKAAKIIIKGS